MLALPAAAVLAAIVLTSSNQSASAAPPGQRSLSNTSRIGIGQQTPRIGVQRFNGPRLHRSAGHHFRHRPWGVRRATGVGPSRYRDAPQRGTSTSFQDVFAQLCGSCRRRCVSGAGMIACFRRPFNAAACTAAINACLAGCQRRYCRRSGR
jgi:hypothetical protein